MADPVVQYVCPQCWASVASPASLVGGEDRCPQCGAVCTVPEARSRLPMVLAVCVGTSIAVFAVLAVVLWPPGRAKKGARGPRGGGDVARVPATPKPQPAPVGKPKPVPPVTPKPKPKPPVTPKPKPKPPPPVKPKPPPVPAVDWPQWRGPNRDGISADTGLLKRWPDEGPTLAWKVSGLGPGYSSVSIRGYTLFTMGDISTGYGAKRQCIIALDLRTRVRLWSAEIGPTHSGGGPRCTPTVHDGLVYAVGTSGDLVCVEADTGKERWRKNFATDFDSPKAPGRRFSESPLIDGQKLICTPGGPDALLVALDKKTGRTIWKCSVPPSERSGGIHAQYSSVVVAEARGVRQYITLIASKGLVGVRARDGQFLWSYRRIVNGTANVPTSVVHGEHVFCSTAYDTGSALLKLTGTGAEEVYFLGADTFQNHHGGFVRVGEYIYGGHGHNAGAPTCIEMKTGKIMWQERQPGRKSAAVVYADGHLYFRYEGGEVALVEATPEAYRQKGLFTLPLRSGPAWSHPVVAGGKLYLRWYDTLFCYDVKAR